MMFMTFAVLLLCFLKGDLSISAFGSVHLLWKNEPTFKHCRLRSHYLQIDVAFLAGIFYWLHFFEPLWPNGKEFWYFLTVKPQSLSVLQIWSCARIICGKTSVFLEPDLFSQFYIDVLYSDRTKNPRGKKLAFKYFKMFIWNGYCNMKIIII